MSSGEIVEIVSVLSRRSSGICNVMHYDSVHLFKGDARAGVLVFDYLLILDVVRLVPARILRLRLFGELLRQSLGFYADALSDEEGADAQRRNCRNAYRYECPERNTDFFLRSSGFFILSVSAEKRFAVFSGVLRRSLYIIIIHSIFLFEYIFLKIILSPIGPNFKSFVNILRKMVDLSGNAAGKGRCGRLARVKSYKTGGAARSAGVNFYNFQKRGCIIIKTVLYYVHLRLTKGERARRPLSYC